MNLLLMPLHESKSNAEPTATADSAARTTSDSNRKSRTRVSRAIGLSRPRVQILHNQHRVSIFDIVKVLGLRPGYFTNDCDRCSFGNGRGIEKLMLDGEESPLRLLTIRNRPLTLIE